MSKRTVLITGANRGLGLETARQMGKLGYHVYLGVRDLAKGESVAADLAKEGIESEAVLLDMANPATIAPAIERIAAKSGSLDALVNNAGVNLDEGRKASEIPVDAIRETYEINVFNVIALIQAALPLLEKSPAGRIVNLSSILGSLTYNSDPKAPLGDWRLLGYNSSKTALNAVTAIFSYELRNSKIKINSAHPGWVKTDLGGPNAPMELEDGAKTTVWLATLPDDGPTGGYFHMQDRLPW